MTNEGKASKISDGYDYLFDKRERDASYYSALEMAEWKDQQFKEYLEKKKSEYGIDYNVNPIDMLNEIIEELFGEEVTDQTDNDE